MSQLVQTARRGHVLILSIEREGKRNAVNQEIADGIDAGLRELDDDPELWVGVLTGTATVFSAGSDLTGQGAATADGGEYGMIRRDRHKPLIAAVEGIALGGGLEIVLACDLVVAARDARFGLPEVRRGLIPTCGALFRAPRAMPLNLARELILTGDPISAERAYAAGFVNVLSEPGDALHDAVSLAGRICESAPLSVQACLRAVNALVAGDDGDGWDATAAALDSLVGTRDTAEGVRAFFEKRPPEWTGR
jgi:enoyl-CoA hydratase/carnithine racemase